MSSGKYSCPAGLPAPAGLSSNMGIEMYCCCGGSCGSSSSDSDDNDELTLYFKPGMNSNCFNGGSSSDSDDDDELTLCLAAGAGRAHSSTDSDDVGDTIRFDFKHSIPFP